MDQAITIHYPVGGESSLTGQTKQALSSELYRLLGCGTIQKVTQEFRPEKPGNENFNFNIGIFIIGVTPVVSNELVRVQKCIEEQLIFHPGSTIQP